MASRKRKHTSGYRLQPPTQTEPDPSLFIQAYEADITSGSQALSSAQSLEVETLPDGLKRVGESLIRWGGGAFRHVVDSGDGPGSVEEEGKNRDVWVDRYDARLLLDILPSNTEPVLAAPDRPSPTGWSDIPSDSEDTFFFLPDEAEDYRREKRRRMFDGLREERLRAIQREEEEELRRQVEERGEDTWGGSDEEPDEKEKDLMRRTATHLLTSPNPAQLEMRILANHGADLRFAFLKGRWSRAWRTMKVRVRAEKAEKENAAVSLGLGGGGGSSSGVALGGLAGYGDSSGSDGGDDGDDESEKTGEEVEGLSRSDVMSAGTQLESEDALKAARRARAKEWAEKRRGATAKGGNDSG